MSSDYEAPKILIEYKNTEFEFQKDNDNKKIDLGAKSGCDSALAQIDFETTSFNLDQSSQSSPLNQSFFKIIEINKPKIIQNNQPKT